MAVASTGLMSLQLAWHGRGFGQLSWAAFAALNLPAPAVFLAVFRRRLAPLQRQRARLDTMFGMAATCRAPYVRIPFADFLMPVDEIVRIGMSHDYHYLGTRPPSGGRGGTIGMHFIRATVHPGRDYLDARGDEASWPSG